MANTFKFGNGNWASKKEAVLAYNDENSNFKPLPFTFDRASSATVVNKQGLIETVGTDEPRIDFLNNSKGHLLLEPERRNSITNSEEFGSTGWSFVTTGSAIAPIVSDNYAISPDGTQNAQRIQFDLGGGTTSSDKTIIRQNIASQNDWFLSVWMKSTDGTEQKILWHSNSDTNETVVTGEWKRFTFSRNGVTNSWAGLSLKGGVSDFDTADILVYGFQAEQGSYATSYIPTQGSAVTRSLETMPNYLDITPLNIGNSYTLFLDANLNVNENNKVFLQLITSSSQTSFTVRNNLGGVRAYNQIDSNYPVFKIISSNNKFVIRVDGNSYKIFTQGESLSGTLTTQRDLGKLNFIGNNTELKINNFTIYNTALSDAECQALTS